MPSYASWFSRARRNNNAACSLIKPWMGQKPVAEQKLMGLFPVRYLAGKARSLWLHAAFYGLNKA